MRTRGNKQFGNVNTSDKPYTIDKVSPAQGGFSMTRLLIICFSSLVLTAMCSLTVGTQKTSASLMASTVTESLPNTNPEVQTSSSDTIPENGGNLLDMWRSKDSMESESSSSEQQTEAPEEETTEETLVQHSEEKSPENTLDKEVVKAPEEDMNKTSVEVVVPVQGVDAEDRPFFHEVNAKHKIVSGYKDTMAFLTAYNASTPVFILLMCDKDETTGVHWEPLCSAAEETIYGLLKETTLDMLVLEVRVGSASDWESARSEFRTERTFKVKHIPTMIRWEGNGVTSDYLARNGLVVPELVEYVLDGKKHMNSSPILRDIPSFDKHEDMDKVLDAYDGSHKLYLFLLSGRMTDIGRSWCPYCRLSEIPVEYHFLKFAPESAKLVEIHVSNTYGKWKAKDNPFKIDTRLNTHAVPALLLVSKSATGDLIIEKFQYALDDYRALRELFADDAVVEERLAPGEKEDAVAAAAEQ